MEYLIGWFMSVYYGEQGGLVGMNWKHKSIFFILIVASALVLGSFLHAPYGSPHNETLPVFARTIFLDGDVGALTQDFLQLHIPEAVPHLIPLCPATGLFYSPATHKIYLPPGFSVTQAMHNLSYYIHRLEVAGGDFPMGSRLLFADSQHVIAVSQRGGELTIHTRPATRLVLGDGYIAMVNLRDMYHTIIVIDPGHGGIDTGAPNALGRAEPPEADIVLAISQKVVDMIDLPGVLLIPTRTENIHVPNAERYRMANRVADYFVSIHANACTQSPRTGGTLTLYGSGEGSGELAAAFQTALVEALGSQDRGTLYSPEIRVLGGDRIPRVLLELLFLSNPTEAARLTDPDTQQLIAQTIANVIEATTEKIYSAMYKSSHNTP